MQGVNLRQLLHISLLTCSWRWSRRSPESSCVPRSWSYTASGMSVPMLYNPALSCKFTLTISMVLSQVPHPSVLT